MTTYYAPFVAIVNESSVLSDAEVAAVVPAFQHAATYMFEKEWSSRCHLAFMPAGSTLPKGAWVFQILDTSDQAGALAYHDVDGKNVPAAKIFAKTEFEYGASWTVSLTHELWEALADPVCLAAAQISQSQLVAYEVCDPCEDDSLAFTVQGVLVSDFVTRNWFTPGAPGPWDHTAHLTGPLTLAPGGYVSIATATSTGLKWSQHQAQAGRLVDVSTRPDARPTHGARFDRVDGYRSWARGRQEGTYLDSFVHQLPGDRVEVAHGHPVHGLSDIFTVMPA
jgi:hypothetical protein